MLLTYLCIYFKWCVYVVILLSMLMVITSCNIVYIFTTYNKYTTVIYLSVIIKKDVCYKYY